MALSFGYLGWLDSSLRNVLVVVLNILPGLSSSGTECRRAELSTVSPITAVNSVSGGSTCKETWWFCILAG